MPSVAQASHDPPAPPAKAAVQKTVNFSNLKKIYWPAEKYTKGDLIDYYRAVSKWLLPYLANRPIVLTRFPDGIDGKSFYQKDAPVFVPDWIPTVPIWSEDTQREIRYFICDSEEALLYIANMGSIPIHMWASREGSLELPDWCVIDLDPKEAPFSDVIRCAQVLHRICESVGLPNFVKTTGKTGLHIMLPLGRQCTYEQSRMLGELLARCVLRELNDIATITRHVTKRGDKVYLDYLQNRHGQTIVTPLSARPLPGATVSMPLRLGRSERLARSEGVHDQERARADGAIRHRSGAAGTRDQAGPRDILDQLARSSRLAASVTRDPCLDHLLGREIAGQRLCC